MRIGSLRDLPYGLRENVISSERIERSKPEAALPACPLGDGFEAQHSALALGDDQHPKAFRPEPGLVRAAPKIRCIAFNLGAETLAFHRASI